RDDGGESGLDVVGDEVADGHAAQGARRGTTGAAPAVADPEEKGRGRDVAHGDVADRDVLDVAAVHRLQGQAARAVEHAVGDRDVLEAAVRLRAELDAAGHAVAIRRLLLRAPVGPAEEGPEVVARDLAVRDGDVFGRAPVAESVGALQHDGDVVGRVDAGVGDAHVPAGIDVETVAVGVDLHVVDGEVVHAGGQDGEVAALEDREIAQEDVA